jgi:hypothetical protein
VVAAGGGAGGVAFAGGATGGAAFAGGAVEGLALTGGAVGDLASGRGADLNRARLSLQLIALAIYAIQKLEVCHKCW